MLTGNTAPDDKGRAPLEQIDEGEDLQWLKLAFSGNRGILLESGPGDGSKG